MLTVGDTRVFYTVQLRRYEVHLHVFLYTKSVDVNTVSIWYLCDGASLIQ